MFEEPDEEASELPPDPAERAREKSDEFRMHAELAAVFEGCRKFDAKLVPTLDSQLARELQQSIGRLEKSKTPQSPVLPPTSAAEATGVLSLAQSRELATNDYHIHRRPGEVMIVRWLAGAQVESFYERLQAHFDVALNAFRQDERHNLQWRQDPKTLEYLAALDALEVKMADRYIRDAIRQHKLNVLSTQSADEINIAFLCDYIMGVSAQQVVGRASAPPPEPTDEELAWFFKLFSLRGLSDAGIEQMCFFAFLQKSDDEFDPEA